MADFFSTSAMKRVMKSETDKRVSKDSADELREELRDYAKDVVEDAIEIAEGKGRKTVREEDIKEALK